MMPAVLRYLSYCRTFVHMDLKVRRDDAGWVGYDLRSIGLRQAPLVATYHMTRAHNPIRPHHHGRAMEICFLVKGRQSYRVGAKTYDMVGQDVFWAAPDEEHATMGKAHGRGVLYWMLVVLPVPGRDFLCIKGGDAKPLVQELRNLPRRHFRGSERLKRGFERIIQQAQSSDVKLRKVLSALAVADWLQEIIACARADAPAVLSPDIRSVKAMIEAHPETDVPLSEMARRCGLCLSHFKAKFRKQVGMPPSEYRLRQRTERARRLLADTSMSVTEIAFELGFSSSQHFARTFRRFTNLCPTDVRRTRGQSLSD